MQCWFLCPNTVATAVELTSTDFFLLTTFFTDLNASMLCGSSEAFDRLVIHVQMGSVVNVEYLKPLQGVLPVKQLTLRY